MRIKMAALLFLFVSGNFGYAFADRTIFKCKTSQGMAYQKTPCADGEESVSSWKAPEDTGQVGKRTMTLEQNYGGHYFLDSEINGNAVTFMIDTGATMVTLPNSVATAAELDCRRSIVLQTANGNTSACMAVIDKLKLGNFMVRDVDAVIVPNLSQPLLGMNVLRRFTITQESTRMHITEH